MTDYKQLCIELVELGSSPARTLQELAVRMSLVIDLAERASAALAEPEPEGPTDVAIMEKACEFFNFRGNSYGDSFFATSITARTDPMNSMCNFTRDALASWGNHRAILGSPLQPIPVSERLPVAENCNADGEVWAWRRFDPESDLDNGDHWMLAFHEWLEDEDCEFTHWLPAHALPLPS